MMKRMLTGWACSLFLGQILLLALLLNDPESVDGVLDLILWFFLFPILAAMPFVFYKGFRLHPSSWRYPQWLIVGLSFPLALLVLAEVRFLPPLIQLFVALLCLVAPILIISRYKNILTGSAQADLIPWVLPALMGVNLLVWIIDRIPATQPSENPRVLLFGVDGADWQILDDLLAKGQLPQISRGLNSGCRAELLASEPLFSPILWTTIATGRPAAEHGLCGRLSDLNASAIRCRRIWDMAEERGKTCGAVQYLGLWPLGPSPSQFAVPSVFEGGLQSRPDGYQFIARFFRDFKAKPSPGLAAFFMLASLKNGMRLSTATFALATGARSLVIPSPYRRRFLQYRFYLLLERLHLDAFCHLHRSRPAELVLYYYPGSDTIQHLFFRAYRPAAFAIVEPGESRWLEDAIPETYREVDRTLGRILARMGPETRVLLVSDHGMKATPELVVSGYGRVYHGRNAFPPLLGYAESEIEWIQGLDRVYLSPRLETDITYAQLMERAASAQRESDGSPLWRVGFRDGWGQFRAQAPLDDTTRGWIELTFRVPDLWPDTAAIRLPAGLAQVQDLAVTADQILVQAGHHHRGVFLAWGPGLRRGEIVGEVAQLDVLPTLMALLGLPTALDLHGRVADIFSAPAMAKLPEPLKTYENPPWIPLQLPQDRDRDVARKALLEQMRSRGYLN